MQLITLKYRIKDSTTRKHLSRWASSVNFVWNYCNETSNQYIVHKGKFLSGFDLNNLTAGCSKGLGLRSETIQATCEEYAARRRKAKSVKLNWRSYKRNLGWIPFKAGTVKYLGDGRVKYNGVVIKFWESRPVGKIRMGSFSQDSKGNWYINFVCVDESQELPRTGREVGVDFGLKTTATYSTGASFEGVKPYRKYEQKLAMAQRAGKKKQVKNISRKIANIRKDSLHKETTRLVRENDLIVVGDVSSKKMVKTKFAKSTLDVSWGAFKSFLGYKAIKLGREVKVVNESWTSKTCHCCGHVADFGGLSGLSVRDWTCDQCGVTHDRDINAAINILRIGHDTPIKGISHASA